VLRVRLRVEVKSCPPHGKLPQKFGSEEALLSFFRRDLDLLKVLPSTPLRVVGMPTTYNNVTYYLK
jgi:hypothetical protein